jgi:hypothetical protein
MDKKICPLRKMEYEDAYNREHIADWLGCLEEKCAWWTGTQCAILKLVNKSFSICK